jgi:phosphohistidine phosphatase
MMQVFLVRHAIAYERDRSRWRDDALRPLTPAGRRKFRKAARGLARCLPKSSALLTSPFVRARETAAILAATTRRSKPVECPELASGEPARKTFDLLCARKERSVILVGHEPNLSTFLSTALAADRAHIKSEFKKGGAACIEFESTVEPGRATLKWLMPPRLLRALA